MAWMPSWRMKHSEEDPIRAMAKYVNKDTVRFDIGEPDGGTPLHVDEAITKAMKEGKIKYSPTGGMQRLKELTAEYHSRLFGRTIKSNQVAITTGTTEAISSTIAAYANPEDKVIIPDPHFPKYRDFVKDAGAIPVPVSIVEKCGEFDNFSLKLKELEYAVKEHKPKMLIVNSPGNPAGNVECEAMLEDMVEICDENDVKIIFDQIYSRHVYDTTFTSVGQLTDNAVITDGFSKAEKMTGWRIGFAITPTEEVAKNISKVQSDRTTCPNTAAQIGAIALYENLEKTEEFVRQTIGEFKERRDFIVRELNSIEGIRCSTPEGAFYAFPRIEGTEMTSQEFTETLVKKANVTTVPGSAFGKCGEGYVRFAYTKPIEKIAEGMKRIRISLEDVS